MTKVYQEELFEYMFRTLEVMNAQELPELSPEQAQVLPSNTKVAQIVASAANVRQMYQMLKEQHDPE